MASDDKSPSSKDKDVIKDLLDYVPPQLYFSPEDKQKLRLAEADLPSVSKAKKRGGRSHGAAPRKRSKFNPDGLTVSELHERLHQWNALQKLKQQREDKLNLKRQKRVQRQLEKRRKTENGTADATGDAAEPEEDMDVDEAAQGSPTGSPDDVIVPPKSHYEELQERFRQKLEEIKSKRRASGKTSDEEERLRLKRREKRIKDKIRKRGKKQGQDKMAAPIQGQVKVSPAAKQIRNKEGKVVFSKFDFQDKVKRDDEASGRNYKHLLQLAEKKKEKMAALKKSDPARAIKEEEKDMWSTALKRAEGVKVKDNPEMLRKALKRTQKRKDKVKKDWDSRVDNVNKRMKEKQDKRKANIKKRKQAKIDKKIKKGKKKGHIIPGF